MRTTPEADLRGASGKAPMEDLLLKRAMKDEKNYSHEGWRGREHACKAQGDDGEGCEAGQMGEASQGCIRASSPLPERIQKHPPTAECIHLVLKPRLRAQGIL